MAAMSCGRPAILSRGHARWKPPRTVPLAVGRLYALDLESFETLRPKPSAWNFGNSGSLWSNPSADPNPVSEGRADVASGPLGTLAVRSALHLGGSDFSTFTMERRGHGGADAAPGAHGLPISSQHTSPGAPPAAVWRPPSLSEGKDSLEFVWSLLELPFRPAES